MCTLYSRVGHEVIEPKTTGTLSAVGSAVLIVEEGTGSESELLKFLSEQVISFQSCCMYVTVFLLRQLLFYVYRGNLCVVLLPHHVKKRLAV